MRYTHLQTRTSAECPLVSIVKLISLMDSIHASHSEQELVLSEPGTLLPFRGIPLHSRPIGGHGHDHQVEIPPWPIQQVFPIWVTSHDKVADVSFQDPSICRVQRDSLVESNRVGFIEQGRRKVTPVQGRENVPLILVHH